MLWLLLPENSQAQILINCQEHFSKPVVLSAELLAEDQTRLYAHKTHERIGILTLFWSLYVFEKRPVIIFGLFALAFLVVHLSAQPYRKGWDNIFEAAALLAIIITYSVESYTLAFGDPDDAGLIFVCVLNGIVLVVLVIFLLMDAIPMIVRKIQNVKANRERQKALDTAEEAGLKAKGSFNHYE